LELPKSSDGHIKGVQEGEAPVTIIEYSSFSCGYCALMNQVFDKILEEYPEKIKYVYKHFNRGGIDLTLENAAECAAETDENKFWDMHDYIFKNQKELRGENTKELLIQEAKKLGIDESSFTECLNENRYSLKITNQTNEAYTYAINGTPGIFVNDKFIGGAISYENLKSIIDSFNP
jgi:protein-disulfide isomerase